MVTVTLKRRPGRNRDYRYYFCTAQHNNGLDCRSPERVNAEKIEDFVLGLVVETFRDPEKVMRTLDAAALEKVAQAEEQAGLKATLARELATVEDKRSHLIHLALDNTISDSDLKRQLQDIDKKVEKWRAELQLIRERETQIIQWETVSERAKEIAAGISESVENMSLEDRKELIRNLVERVWVDRENRVTVQAAIPGLVPDEPISACIQPCRAWWRL